MFMEISLRDNSAHLLCWIIVEEGKENLLWIKF